VGLVYAILDVGAATWEVGGLAVAESSQGLGIGTLLMRFALAHTIVYEQPWQNGQELITHVHEANMDPRRILKRLGNEQFDGTLGSATLAFDLGPLSIENLKEALREMALDK
jgi:GNAT superfamily N-acetyltransferase